MTDFNNAHIKVFNGYGHQQNLVVYGQVRKGAREKEKKYTFNILWNIISIAKLFFIKPIPFAKVRMQWNDQSIQCTSDENGFFELQWSSKESTPAGWTSVTIFLLDDNGNETISGEGKVFIPHITQYGFISDIDDTILVSHSSRTGKKIRTLFATDPLKRKTFADVVKFYLLLASSHTEPDVPNPFFYVSSSEWNLYDYLVDFFRSNKLPEGSFLLSDFKRWYQIFKTGGTRHGGKKIRSNRILDVFPNQRFVLIGDNSQQDPGIYAAIANEHPDQIVGVYIRLVRPERRAATQLILESIQNKKVPVFIFEHTNNAIAHAVEIGMINSQLKVSEVIDSTPASSGQ